MLFADCPLCDAPALVDEAAGELQCEPCALVLEIGEPVPVELPVAA